MPRIIIDKTKIKAVFQCCVFLRTYAQYASMNDFTCSEQYVYVGPENAAKDNEKKNEKKKRKKMSEKRKNKTRIY